MEMPLITSIVQPLDELRTLYDTFRKASIRMANEYKNLGRHFLGYPRRIMWHTEVSEANAQWVQSALYCNPNTHRLPRTILHLRKLHESLIYIGEQLYSDQPNEPEIGRLLVCALDDHYVPVDYTLQRLRPLVSLYDAIVDRTVAQTGALTPDRMRPRQRSITRLHAFNASLPDLCFETMPSDDEVSEGCVACKYYKPCIVGQMLGADKATLPDSLRGSSTLTSAAVRPRSASEGASSGNPIARWMLGRRASAPPKVSFSVTSIGRRRGGSASTICDWTPARSHRSRSASASSMTTFFTASEYGEVQL